MGWLTGAFDSHICVLRWHYHFRKIAIKIFHKENQDTVKELTEVNSCKIFAILKILCCHDNAVSTIKGSTDQ